MKLAIMQPYFLPYAGYFKLIASVDRFVLLDDVNYINRGWINRNRVCLDGQPAWLTVPLIQASQNKLIRNIEVQPRNAWLPKMRRTLQHAYARAPYKNEALELFDQATAGEETNLSAFLAHSIRVLCRFLSIKTPIIETSSTYPKESLTGQKRILDICLREGADTYLNPPGGRDLYDSSAFEERGIHLRFQNPMLPSLLRSSDDRVESPLSIIDLAFTHPSTSLSEAIHTEDPSTPN